MADQPQVAVNAAGAALLVWKQTGAALADSSIQARFGASGSVWGPIEPVNDAGADTPVAAIGIDGRAAVAWERENAVSGNTGQARIRAPGAAGAWDDIHNVNATHTPTTPSRRSRRTDAETSPWRRRPTTGAAQPVSSPPTTSLRRPSRRSLCGDDARRRPGQPGRHRNATSGRPWARRRGRSATGRPARALARHARLCEPRHVPGARQRHRRLGQHLRERTSPSR